MKTKLIKIEDLKKINLNKKIVFTNGCFDILHAGHVQYLTEAKRLGDTLVVGINSDSSIRKIKEGRPIVKEEYRVIALSGLSSVDYIIIFNEETPLRLIETIKPAVLVKGEDWKDKGIVGEDFVKAYGGKIMYIKFLEGISTTSIINKILEK